MGISCLAGAEDSIAKDALAHAIAHPLVDVRILATIFLAKTGDRRALMGMAEALPYGAYMGRYDAAEAIKCLRSAAHSFLIQSLQTGTPRLQEVAARVLGDLGCPEAMPALEEALAGHDELKIAAITALARMKADLVLSTLYSILAASSIDLELTRAAIQALRKFPSPDAAAALAGFLLKVLGSIEPGDLLNWRNAAWDAVAALKELGNCASLSEIAVHLSSPNPSVRILVADLIGSLRCSEYVSGLGRLLEDPAEGYMVTPGLGTERITVGGAARSALQAIGAPDSANALAQARSAKEGKSGNA